MWSKPAQLNAPSANKYSLIAQLAGAVIDKTKMTANPKPIDVSTFFEIERNEHIPRKYISKILGKKFLQIFDPSLKNLKVGENEKKAWINDQYFHPIESLHTLDEVLNWFKKNNIDYVSSIPSCDFDYQQNNLKIFEKKFIAIKFIIIYNIFYFKIMTSGM